MLARSRCAPRSWWGTIYEFICFESSQYIFLYSIKINCVYRNTLPTYRWTLLNKSFQTGSSLNQRDHMGSSSRDRKPRNEKHLGIWSEYLVIPTINTFLKVIDHCRFHIFIFVMCLWSEHDILFCPKYQSVQSPQSSSHLQLTYNINHIWYTCIYIYIPICPMYSIFTYIWVIYGVNVGKYSVHGASML